MNFNWAGVVRDAIFFALGSAITYAVVQKRAQKHANKAAQDHVDDLRRWYSNRNEENAELEAELAAESYRLDSLKDAIGRAIIKNEEETEEESELTPLPRYSLITKDEFEDDFGYEKNYIRYIEDSNIGIDEDDMVFDLSVFDDVHFRENIGGEDPDIVYVRNEVSHTDFCIERE